MLFRVFCYTECCCAVMLSVLMGGGDGVNIDCRQVDKDNKSVIIMSVLMLSIVILS